MLKVRTTEQHDWVRLALTEGAGKTATKLSLTWSYSKDGGSATPDVAGATLREAFTKWSRIRNAKTGGSLGQRLHRLAKIAERCSTIKEFVAKMA